jgi:AcrR family transcriptional regulator
MAQKDKMCHSVISINPVVCVMSKSSGAQDLPGSLPKRWGTGERVDDHGKGAARIIAAARNCFARSSVVSTTIDDIAQAAGVSRRTVYRYFDNKEAVVLAVVEAQAEPLFVEMQESLEALRDTSFRGLVKHCVLFSVAKGPQIEGHQLLLGKANAAATMKFYLGSERMRSHFHGLLEAPFRRAQEAGEIDRSWSLDDLLNWIGRLVYSFIQYPEPPDKIEQLVNQFLLPGMSSGHATTEEK